MSVANSVRLPSTLLDFTRRIRIPNLRSLQRQPRTGGTDSELNSPSQVQDPETKLPPRGSLIINLTSALLLQLSFFITVPSANEYALHLGGTSTFAGLVIGIPVAFSGIALFPMTRYDHGQYAMPMHVAIGSSILGNILYALGYRADFLYLILIGRIVSGVGFTAFMYTKRYCTDPRLVGIRRRTTLASCLVITQGLGFTIGPLIGGALYKIGFESKVFNGYTAPAWITAGLWAVFWVFATLIFEDVPPIVPASHQSSQRSSIELQSIPRDEKETVTTSTALDVPGLASASAVPDGSVPSENQTNDSKDPDSFRHLTWGQWGTIFCCCWFAMTCFHLLGGWESNIPVFTSSPSAQSAFLYTPYQAGTFIAIGGALSFPFLLLNLLYARRIQDRYVLVFGASLGMVGILLALALIYAPSSSPDKVNAVNFGGLLVSWTFVATGFNLASTCTLSLLSKRFPGTTWNGRLSVFIQYSNYCGRVTGAVWGGSGVSVGMGKYLGVQITIVGIGMVSAAALWREMKAKTG